MKTNKIIVVAFSVALLLVVAVIAIFVGTKAEVVPVSFIAECDKNSEKITCFKNDKGEYYVFLPSFAKMENLKVILETQSNVKIDGKKIQNNISCKSFKTDKEYSFEFENFGKIQNKTITFLKSQNIPAMYIDTNSGNMDFIYAKKGNSETGKLRTYTADGNLDFDGDLSSINGRGNTTWYVSDKKPYSLELTQSADLLSMGAGKNWILLANAADNSHIRNKLAFDFANNVGLSYTADSNWVDLYLNGEYAGLYLLTERNEIAENRIDISNNGFLLSLELEDRLKEQKRNYIKTESNTSFYVRSPSVLDVRTREKITKKMQTLENAVLSDDGIDKESGKHWRELIDLDSWVKKYLVDEILGNFDGGYISHYLYADDNSKIYAGPVWDYDISLGNGSIKAYSIENPNVFVFKRYLNGNAEKNNKVLELLSETEDFKQHSKKIFFEEFYPLKEKYLSEKLPEYVSLIKKSANMNAIRWSKKKASFEAEVATVSKYLDEHTEFLNSVWIEEQEVCQVSFIGLTNDLFYTVKPGGTLSQLPQVKDTENAVFKGFYYSSTDEPFDKTAPITEDTEVYAKWEAKPKGKLGRIIKYSPILIISAIFLVFVIIDFKRNKWGGG